MQCKSLWIKASAKCINVNVNVKQTNKQNLSANEVRPHLQIFFHKQKLIYFWYCCYRKQDFMSEVNLILKLKSKFIMINGWFDIWTKKQDKSTEEEQFIAVYLTVLNSFYFYAFFRKQVLMYLDLKMFRYLCWKTSQKYSGRKSFAV